MSFKDRLKSMVGIGDDYEEYEAEAEYEKEPKNAPKSALLGAGKDKRNRVIVFRELFCFDDVRELGDALRDNMVVHVNLQRCTPTVAGRVIDFLSGSVYMTEGTMCRAGAQIFICAPKGVELDGYYDMDADKKQIQSANEMAEIPGKIYNQHERADFLI